MTDSDDQPSWLKNHQPATAPPAHLWKPGQSGNPAGRKPGVPNKRDIAAKAIVDEIGSVLSVLIGKAKEGDVAAIALLLNRVIPTLRPRAEKVQFALDTKASLTEQAGQVLQSMADGALDPDTSAQILTAIKALSDLQVNDDLLARVAAIEARSGIVRNEAPGGVLQVASEQARLCE